MQMAKVMSNRSTCVNRQVGCIIVDKGNRPISAGYNGPPAKWGRVINDGDTCANYCDRGNSANRTADYDNCVSVHAEMNALMFADRKDYYGGTIYVTSPCCFSCAKAVANSGVVRVVVLIRSSDSHAFASTALDFLRECKIIVEEIYEL